jgi:hypothetical protein
MIQNAGKATGSKLARLTLALVLATGLAACGGGGGGASQDSPSSGVNTVPVTPPPSPPPPVTPPPPSPPPPAPPGNHAPTIDAVPITTARIGQLYTFQPTASDADGDPLTFTIVNKPDWATFNTATGRLQGTPPAGSTGALLTVPITVSDGQASASMDLRIDVVEPTVGSATLRWQTPLTNEDGTPLTDLAGYVIRYGRTKSALDQSLQVNDANATSYVVENLTAGTWFFTMSSINSAGAESKPTSYLSKTIS